MRPFCDTCDYWDPGGKRHCLILSGGRQMEAPPCSEHMAAPEPELRWRERDPRWRAWTEELRARLEARRDADGADGGV